jgi:hypothetical protein
MEEMENGGLTADTIHGNRPSISSFSTYQERVEAYVHDAISFMVFFD